MTQEKIPFRCRISPSDSTAPLTMRIVLDGQEMLPLTQVTEPIAFECWLEDVEQQHELTFEMQGKTEQHTILSSTGEIEQDAHLMLDQFSIDEIELSGLTTFEYHHDYNGTQPPVIDKFFGYMGCNGVVSVKFTTPIYLWLLENM